MQNEKEMKKVKDEEKEYQKMRKEKKKEAELQRKEQNRYQKGINEKGENWLEREQRKKLILE